MCCLGKGYLLVEWFSQWKPSNFSQPIPRSLKVSPIYVTWHLPSTRSCLISSQIENREMWADWRDKSLVVEGQRHCESEGRKMWTQSAMCWLYWLGACAKKNLSIPSFLLFTLCFTTCLSAGITATRTPSESFASWPRPNHHRRRLLRSPLYDSLVQLKEWPLN